MDNAITPFTGWRKMVYASPHRKSRFHTENGELMPLSSWLRMPLTLIERILRLDKNRPWLVPAAIDRLQQIIEPDWRVFELGAGASTAWLASRVRHVLSCETQLNWYEQVVNQSTADIRYMPEDQLVDFVDEQPDESFDLVFIDSNGDRFQLIAAAKRLVKPGGSLLLDNSDRYTQALQLLDGWKRETFIGTLPRPFCAQETSIFRRP